MLLIILVLPLLGFFSGSIFGRILGKGVGFITTSLVFLSSFFSTLLFLDVLNASSIKVFTLCDWIYSDILKIDWSISCDSLTCIMLFVVTFISMLVHLYSIEYMAYDPHFPRFMSYLSLFTFFMLILVTGNSFLQMFVGWEGVGVSSYLLINFWFTRIQANKAAIKAMLVNRIGDFFLLLAIFTLIISFNSLNYDSVFCIVPMFQNFSIDILSFEFGILDLICFFIFLGAMGKSAQLGLHTWLPDAMEGPTPVSALIHAATMVTAGVFLIIRCSYIFEHSPFVLSIITCIGAMTAFFAATTGLFQNDMKKVIAYSTCSQLGYMVFACGLSSYDVSLFHLSNHAFFKALLFLGAGSIIHALSDEQDMRKMGGLRSLLPFSYAVSLIGSLALIGFPFLSGFYSKDVILEVSISSFTSFGHFAFILGLLAAFCTAFYSTRLLYLVFLSPVNGNKRVIVNAHEGSVFMSFPLIVLAFLSIFVGYLTKEIFIGFGTTFWGSALFIKPTNYLGTDIEFLHIIDKLLPLVFTLLGVVIAYIIYKFNLAYFFNLKSKSLLVYSLINFFNKKWFFDRVYNEFFVEKILFFGHSYFYKMVDKGLIEHFGPFAIQRLIVDISKHIKVYQNGYILSYIYYFSLSILLLGIITFFEDSYFFVLFLFCFSYYKNLSFLFSEARKL